MKINIIELEKELFYNLVGDKKTTGLFYKKVNNKFIIFIKNSISKKNKKLTIEHELSHLFIYKFKLKNKINKKEFLRVLKDKNFEIINKLKSRFQPKLSYI